MHLEYFDIYTEVDDFYLNGFHYWLVCHIDEHKISNDFYCSLVLKFKQY